MDPMGHATFPALVKRLIFDASLDPETSDNCTDMQERGRARVTNSHIKPSWCAGVGSGDRKETEVRRICSKYNASRRLFLTVTVLNSITVY